MKKRGFLLLLFKLATHLIFHLFFALSILVTNRHVGCCCLLQLFKQLGVSLMLGSCFRPSRFSQLFGYCKYFFPKKERKNNNGMEKYTSFSSSGVPRAYLAMKYPTTTGPSPYNNFFFNIDILRRRRRRRRRRRKEEEERENVAKLAWLVSQTKIKVDVRHIMDF